MTVVRYDRKTKKETEYKLPEGSEMYVEDLDSTICCASCGKKVVAGDTFTSMEIMNGMGFGYLVCEKCYEQEYKRRYNEGMLK